MTELEALFASQKALEGINRMLQTVVIPAVNEAIRISQEALTEAQLKQTIQKVENDGY